MRNNFGVIIISHGRADYLKKAGTVHSLKRSGYTGRVVVVIDDEDDQADLYRKNFKDVWVFNKDQALDEVQMDLMNNFYQKECSTYARNIVWKAAAEYGFEYFAVCDDDITMFQVRWEEKGGVLKQDRIRKIDDVFDVICEWMKASDAYSIGIAPAGWMIGGANGSQWKRQVRRFVANCYVCRRDKQFRLNGGINEDLVACAEHGMRGHLLMSVMMYDTVVAATQSVKGGMSEEYLDSGTYVKAFYLVMMNPSAFSICAMGQSHNRIHHRVEDNAAFPKIINEKYRKWSVKA